MRAAVFLFSAILALLCMAPSKGLAMELKDALAMVQGWAEDSKDPHFVAKMKVEANGEFITKARGAFFRYSPKTGVLLVSGLVRYNTGKLFSVDPELWQELLRAGEREKVTLGEGQFELYTKPLFDLEPDVVLLTKAYDRPVERAQFAREVRWLLAGAYQWFMFRYNEVTTTPEAELIRQAPERNAKWPKRPW
jgi:hypothetical protein